jgi:hydroxymethylpyrimidine/phosphomethylpyrimidine kinase
MPEAKQNKVILTVAGSDPSGGAGIQADLKTFAVLGVYGAAAITCLTAQNTRGVASVLPVDPLMVARQIELVLTDLPVTHVKIGMVGTSDIAKAIGTALSGFAGEVVYDPVLKATAGNPLLEPTAVTTIKEQVISRATVLTPNLPELQALTGLPCTHQEEIIAAGRRLFANFPNLRAIIIKGGHGPLSNDRVTDYLLLPAGSGDHDWFQTDHPWLNTSNSHGTGCTFASGFAAFHLLTGSYPQAFSCAATFLEQLLTISADSHLGHGTGPLLHHLFPRNVKPF